MDVKNSMILQAQKEVRAHTHDFLVLPVVAFFDSLYAQTQKKDGKLATFQKELREVPNWPLLRVQSVLGNIQLSCDFLPQLISAMFLGHIKVLSSIKISKAPNVKVKIPKQEKFVHALFIESARRFYENPHVFRKGDHYAKTTMVMEAIDATIRKFLPLRDILSAYLVKSKGATPQDANGEGEDEEEYFDEEEDEEGGDENDHVDDVFDDTEEADAAEEAEEGSARPDAMDIAGLARTTPVPNASRAVTPAPSATPRTQGTPKPQGTPKIQGTPKTQEKTIAIDEPAPAAAAEPSTSDSKKPTLFDDSDIEENV